MHPNTQILTMNPARHKAGKWPILIAVVCLWIGFAVQENYFMILTESLYQQLFSFFGQPDFLYNSQENARGILSKNGTRLINLTSGLIYCGFGLLTLHQYINNRTYTRLALGLYLSLSVFSLLINTAGNSFQIELLRILAFRIMSLVVSPMPVVLLISAYYLTGKSGKEKKYSPNHF